MLSGDVNDMVKVASIRSKQVISLIKIVFSLLIKGWWNRIFFMTQCKDLFPSFTFPERVHFAHHFQSSHFVYPDCFNSPLPPLTFKSLPARFFSICWLLSCMTVIFWIHIISVLFPLWVKLCNLAMGAKTGFREHIGLGSNWFGHVGFSIDCRCNWGYRRDPSFDGPFGAYFWGER